MEGRNVYFRCISLYYFRKGINASKTHKKICAVYGENAVSESVCRKWFAKFRSGHFDLEDAPRSGRPVTTDVEQIKALIESGRNLTTTEIGYNLNIDQSTVSRHLRKLGMVPKKALPEHKITLDPNGKTRTSDINQETKITENKLKEGPSKKKQRLQKADSNVERKSES